LAAAATAAVHLHFSHFFAALVLLNRLQLIVDITEVCIELLVVLYLFLALDIAAHFSVPGLSDDLCLTDVTVSRDLSRLLDAVSHQHIRVSLLFKLITLIRDHLIL